MRIAILVPEYRTPQVKFGGLISVADSYQRMLSTVKGVELEIVSPRLWSRAPENFKLTRARSWSSGSRVSVAAVEGTKITYVGSRFALFEPARYVPSKVLTQKLDEFDVVIAICGTSAFFGLLRNTTALTIGTYATFTPLERKRMLESKVGITRFLRQIIANFVTRQDILGLQFPTKLVAMNSNMEDFARLRGFRGVEVIPPPVSVPDLAAAAGFKADVRNREFVQLLAVGRLGDPRKGFSDLLKVVSLLDHSTVARLRLTIAGAGPVPAELELQVSQLGLSNLVTFVPDPSPDDLEDSYRSADLFVLTSSEEGFGMVFVEAMSYGVPVLTTRTDGAEFILSGEKAGELVPFGDTMITDFAKHLEGLLADPIALEDMGAAARALVEHRFSDSVVRQQVLRLLGDVSNNH